MLVEATAKQKPTISVGARSQEASGNGYEELRPPGGDDDQSYVSSKDMEFFASSDAHPLHTGRERGSEGYNQWFRADR